MKPLLLLTLLIFGAAGLWVVIRAGKEPSLSISLHAAATRLNRVVFGIAIFSATILLSIVAFGWLLPHYSANIISQITFVIILLCLFTIALIPHMLRTWREYVHNSAAWGMVFIIPLAMSLMLQWTLSPFAWLATAVFTIVNSILLFIALVSYERLRPSFLYFQVAYLAVFFSSLVVVSYC